MINLFILLGFINEVPDNQRVSCAIVMFVAAGVCFLALLYFLKCIIKKDL